MEILGKKGLGSILKTILQVFFYLGIVISISLPFILKKFDVNITNSMIIIYPNSAMLLIITNNFIKLFDSLKKENPFCEDNVKLLKNTGIVTFIEAFLWIADLIYSITIAKFYDAALILILIFMAILFFGVSIALYILSEMLRQANNYKEENELTI